MAWLFRRRVKVGGLNQETSPSAIKNFRISQTNQ